MTGPGPANRVELTDSERFEALFRTHYAGLCDFVNGYVSSPEAARDIVHDLYLWLWQRYDAGEPPPFTKPYLYAAARNRAFKFLRHRRVVSRWEQRVAYGAEPAGPETDEEVRAREVAEAVEAAIEALPPRCREIFRMSRQEELTPAEIARALGISESTVGVQLWRALKVLRERLAPYLVVAMVAVRIVE